MNAQGGTLFGRYRLLRTIASDAVSATYFATVDGGPRRSRSAAEHFAVRVAARVDPADAEAIEVARTYLAQAQEAGIIDHPTVVRPLDVGMIDGRPYVATPFVRAVPLGELLVHGGTINQSAALAMFAQLAGALDAAHRAGIVHGAVSPRTIWVGPSAGEGVAYVAYLTGFGTSTLLRWHMEDAPPGPPVEDVFYVAPEQLRGEPADAASDQYSLACAVFHTLGGHPPFERETRAKLYGAHLLAPPPQLDSDGGTVFAGSSAALMAAMSKEPAERYATCGELIHDALPDEPSGAAYAVAPQPAPRAGTVPRRAWSRLVVAVLAFVVAMVALWVAVGGQEGGDRTGAQPPAQIPAQAMAGASQPEPTVAAPAYRTLWRTPVTAGPIMRIDALDQAVLAAGGDSVAVLDTVDGTVRWHHDLDGATELATDGALVVYGDSALTAVAVNHGELRWGSDDLGTIRSLAAGGDAIVASAGPKRAPGVLALDVRGDELWRWDGVDGAGGRPTVAVDRDIAYVLRGGALTAIPAIAQRRPSSPDGAVIDAPAWRVDVTAAWPVLLPADGAVVATRNGEVCRYAARDGGEQWCETVPGVEQEPPRLLTAGRAVVVATPTAVALLDGRTGQRRWSVSPDGADTPIAAGSSRIAVADGAGVRVIANDTGDPVLELTDLADVTAVGLGGGRVYVGSGDGELTAIGLSQR